MNFKNKNTLIFYYGFKKFLRWVRSAVKKRKQMKILISPLDSYLGRTMYRYFTKTKKKEKHEIVGTFVDEANPQFKPNSVKQWISVCI